jgi:MFS family permease
MNDSIPTSSSDSGRDQKVIRSPLLAGICAAICVFSAVVAFFFGGWFRLSSDPEIDCWISYIMSDYRTLIDDAIFLNMFVLSIVSFAGYLFTGALNKRLGTILLLFQGIFGFLYLITMLPRWTGVYFIPFFIRQDLIGNVGLDDLPYYSWFFLTMIVIPIVYFIGTLKTKTVPAWKSIVLIVAPLFVWVFTLFSILRFGISDYSYSFVFSRGMAFWVLFAAVIFSELIRTKVKRSYVWLTLILSGVGAAAGVIVIFAMSFWINQRAMENKKASLNGGYDPCSYYRKF